MIKKGLKRMAGVMLAGGLLLSAVSGTALAAEKAIYSKIFSLGKKGSYITVDIKAEQYKDIMRPKEIFQQKYLTVEREGWITNTVKVQVYDKTEKKYVPAKKGGALSFVEKFILEPTHSYTVKVIEDDNSPSRVKVEIGYEGFMK